jgi:hypothetical protein
MFYEFECQKCGERFAEKHPVGSAPALGSESSRRCAHGCQGWPIRVISAVRSNREYQHAMDQYPYPSRRHGRLKGVRSHDPVGHPIIENPAHEREVAKQNGLVRE